MNYETYYKMLSAMKESKCDPVITAELERVGFQQPLGFQGVFPLMIGAIVGQKIRFDTARKLRSQIYTYCGGRNYTIHDFIIQVWRKKSSLNYLRSIGLQEFQINTIRQVIGVFKLPEDATQEWNQPKEDDDPDSQVNREMTEEMKFLQNRIDYDQDIPLEMVDYVFGNIKGIGHWTIENVKLTFLMSLTSEEYEKYKESKFVREDEFALLNDKIIVRNFKYLFGAFVNILEREKQWPLEWRPFILWTLWRGWTQTPDNQAPFRQI